MLCQTAKHVRLNVIIYFLGFVLIDWQNCRNSNGESSLFDTVRLCAFEAVFYTNVLHPGGKKSEAFGRRK